MKRTKRAIDILVLSDIHLGTYGCHAKELLYYLKSIKPKLVVLNGDIIDVWQFRKSYFPKSHMKVVKHLVGWIGKGVKTYYVTGNHDEMLRKFEGLKLGSVKIVNKIVLDLPGDKKAWIFHGDVFDVTMQHSKWLTKLGAVGYDILILINRFANLISEKVFNKGKLSLSKKIKNSVKSAVKFINNFEETCADIGISNGYDYVICGHIHQPEKRVMSNQQGSILYLNSGDWIENLSALEFVNDEWNIYRFNEEAYLQMKVAKEELQDDHELDTKRLFGNLVDEFKQMRV
ncbi:MAG: UDP-2,3-diacylglucosamine diphosphatase [Bacteroidetes bacterium]|nr:UDP-2,3-diacylglucosamine diphosphatase [Bacteroidota bacterium]